MIELVIVFAIIALLASTILSSFAGQRQAKFADEFQRILSYIPTVRSMAMHSATVENDDGEDIEPRGYGVQIDGNIATRFADTEDGLLNAYDAADVLLDDSYTFSEQYEILIEADGNTYSAVSLFYLAPYADMVITVIEGEDLQTITRFTPVTITFRTVDGAFSKSFSINKISGIPEPI